MRRVLLLTALTISGCAHFAERTAAPSPALSVSEDGTTATAGGVRWTAPQGVAFYQRGNVLHAVSSLPGRRWDVAVPLGPDGKLAWPAEGPLEAGTGGTLTLRPSGRSSAVAELIDSGQLYPHDEHFHLTHRLQDPDWQALYRDRAEDSPLNPVRRQVAATVLAMLLDERIPGSSPEATEGALRRLKATIGKARRAVEGDVGARAIEVIVAHDLEIRDGGRTLEVGGQLFRATDEVRFSYCANHFHVEGADGRWAQPIEVEGQARGAFTWPPSIFFSVAPDGTVSERPSSSRWRKLSDAGEVRFTGDHWHVTEAYSNPRLQLILATIHGPRVPEPLKDKARGLALDVMRLGLETGSDAEFEARLGAIDKAIDRAASELEKALRSGGR